MPLLHLFVLAVVQGITEFLPISSSAHLILVPVVTGWQDQGVHLDLAVHAGTLLAVMIYFWRDTRGMALAAAGSLGIAPARRAVEGTVYHKLFWALVIGSVPLGIVGFALWAADLIDLLRRVDLIAAMSILFGLVLYWADQRGPETRTVDSLGIKAAVQIGLAQALSLIPGTSRSGITMTAARALGFTRTESAHFAMLLSIPAVLMTSAPLVIDLVQEGAQGQWRNAVIAGAFAFVAALAAIHFLLSWLRRASMTIFVVYRVILGIVLLVLFL